MLTFATDLFERLEVDAGAQKCAPVSFFSKIPVKIAKLRKCVPLGAFPLDLCTNNTTMNDTWYLTET